MERIDDGCVLVGGDVLSCTTTERGGEIPWRGTMAAAAALSRSLLHTTRPLSCVLTPYASTRSEKKMSTLSTRSSRAAVSGVIATVFGASGFVGRYVVNRLGRIGSQVVVPYRYEDSSVRHLKVMGDLGQIVPLDYEIRDDASVYECLRRSNVVINLIGAPWDTKNFSIDETNHVIPGRIAKLAAEAGVEHMIHVSALGASKDSPSAFGKAKLAGEEAVRTHFPNAVILRPGELFGAEDRLINRAAIIARHWPFIPLVAPRRRFQPMLVSDFASCLMNALENLVEGPQMHLDEDTGKWNLSTDARGKTFELGGPDVVTEEEMFDSVMECTFLQRPKVEVPLSVSIPIANLTQMFRRPRFCPDEILYQQRDAVVSSDPDTLTAETLEVSPVSFDFGITKYSRYYRKPQYLNIITD